MWRFILVSFAFLGLAFYEASGGADYAPAPTSLQVAMKGKPLFAVPREAPTALAEAETAPEPKLAKSAAQKSVFPKPVTIEERTQKMFAGLSGIPEDQRGGFDITLASASQPLNGGDAIEPRAIDAVGTFNVESLVSDVRSIPIDQAVVSTRGSADVRSVAGDIANMRSGPGTNFDKVDQLTRGTDVEVLGRRGAWVELRDLDTGRTGWMADWLVTAAN
ncbi:SH3 domain-containing protein [Roseovarius sp. S4756]|uniref:SH3 domain-containing protein n=1 Tax=Roseovarius maritimus TaxID=3342637 RepID=UPI00372AEC04